MILAALIVFTYASFVSTQVTIDDTAAIFHNTIRKYNVNIRNKRDYHERYRRLVDFKDRVDRSTSGTSDMHTLNRFAVNNNEEHDLLMNVKRQISNITLTAMNDEDKKRVWKRESPSHTNQDWQYAFGPPRTNVDDPDSMEFWEKELGLSEVQDQFGCGSCWSFPGSAALEAVYKMKTGEHVVFSKQYFVDCTFPYSGCAGGRAHETLILTKDRQYLMHEDEYPYTSEYETCKYDEEIANKHNNAMRKQWLTDWYPMGKADEYFVNGLLQSPVVFGSYVGKEYLAYAYGDFEDFNCAKDALPHTHLLVGYTPKILRVRGSYNPKLWGESGYINYKRHSGALPSCKFFDNGYTLSMDWARNIEYKFCSGAKLVSLGDCKNSCQDMNKDGETGWHLATIPTVQHNSQIVRMVNERFPGVKADEKFNLLWIGLKDPEKECNLAWSDPLYGVNYINMTQISCGKYGLIDKNSGVFVMKNNLKFQARGLCSRTTTCADITNFSQKGVFQLSNSVDNLIDGTTAELVCNAVCEHRYETTSLICSKGAWIKNGDFSPECICPGDEHWDSYHDKRDNKNGEQHDDGKDDGAINNNTDESEKEKKTKPNKEKKGKSEKKKNNGRE